MSFVSSLINTKNKKAQDLSCANVKVLSFFVSINAISQRILFIVFSSWVICNVRNRVWPFISHRLDYNDYLKRKGFQIHAMCVQVMAYVKERLTTVMARRSHFIGLWYHRHAPSGGMKLFKKFRCTVHGIRFRVIPLWMNCAKRWRIVRLKNFIMNTLKDKRVKAIECRGHWTCRQGFFHDDANRFKLIYPWRNIIRQSKRRLENRMETTLDATVCGCLASHRMRQIVKDNSLWAVLHHTT